NFAARYSDRIIAMREGVVMDAGTPAGPILYFATYQGYILQRSEPTKCNVRTLHFATHLLD
ncbi:hypothetical protein ACRQGP_04745, partial [Actinotignum sp. GS-2025b]|uniref:hypothetical protein n=1 Tax=Actinotignum sp. GS-2025b TaxID=3427275 RepID=UPI003F476155